MVQTQVRKHALQARVLLLKFTQPLHVRHAYAAVLGPPLVERRRADAVFAGNLSHREPGFGLLQNGGDLTLAVFRFAHGTLLAESLYFPVVSL